MNRLSHSVALSHFIGILVTNQGPSSSWPHLDYICKAPTSQQSHIPRVQVSMDFRREGLCFSTLCENYCYSDPSLTSPADEKSEAQRGEETYCHTWWSLHNTLFQKEIPEVQTPRLVFCAVEWSIEISASRFPCETLSPVLWLGSVGLYLQGYPSWAWRDGDPCF